MCKITKLSLVQIIVTHLAQRHHLKQSGLIANMIPKKTLEIFEKKKKKILKKTNLEMLPVKWQPLCLVPNILTNILINSLVSVNGPGYLHWGCSLQSLKKIVSKITEYQLTVSTYLLIFSIHSAHQYQLHAHLVPSETWPKDMTRQ